MMLVHLKLMWLMYQVLLFNPIKEGQHVTPGCLDLSGLGAALAAKSWVTLQPALPSA